jgi:hypothetical protein
MPIHFTPTYNGGWDNDYGQKIGARNIQAGDTVWLGTRRDAQGWLVVSVTEDEATRVVTLVVTLDGTTQTLTAAPHTRLSVSGRWYHEWQSSKR